MWGCLSKQGVNKFNPNVFVSFTCTTKSFVVTILFQTFTFLSLQTSNTKEIHIKQQIKGQSKRNILTDSKTESFLAKQKITKRKKHPICKNSINLSWIIRENTIFNGYFLSGHEKFDTPISEPSM